MHRQERLWNRVTQWKAETDEGFSGQDGSELGSGAACFEWNVPRGGRPRGAWILFAPRGDRPCISGLCSRLKVLEDYDHESTYYAPDVEKSTIESHNGDYYRVFLRFRRHKIVTVVLDTEHDVTYYRDSATREHSRSSAVRIAQVVR